MGIGEWFGFGKKTETREPIIEVPAAPTSESLLAALDGVEKLAKDGVVPPMVMARLKRVTNVVRQTIPRLDALGGDSASAYNVMATATDYLPAAIGGYLRLPRDWADSRPVDRGKTSLLILIDQLDLLGSTMDKVFDAVCRADAQALVVHGRFLQEKFGTPAGGGLAVDPGTALPPMPGSPLLGSGEQSSYAAPTAPGLGSPAAAGGSRAGADDDTGDVPLAQPRPSGIPNGLDLPSPDLPSPDLPSPDLPGPNRPRPPDVGRLAPPIGREA